MRWRPGPGVRVPSATGGLQQAGLHRKVRLYQRSKHIKTETNQRLWRPISRKCESTFTCVDLGPHVQSNIISKVERGRGVQQPSMVFDAGTAAWFSSDGSVDGSVMIQDCSKLFSQWLLACVRLCQHPLLQFFTVRCSTHHKHVNGLRHCQRLSGMEWNG